MALAVGRERENRKRQALFRDIKTKQTPGQSGSAGAINMRASRVETAAVSATERDAIVATQQRADKSCPKKKNKQTKESASAPFSPLSWTRSPVSLSLKMDAAR